MKLEIINNDSCEYAKSILSPLYNKGMIAPEKKEYITDLKNSTGPYLAIHKGDKNPSYILDCASQIASLGLGFNPTSFFGVNHYLEAHTNNPDSQEFRRLLNSYKSFLKRKLDTDLLGVQFTGSGAEAIETALGHAYESRVSKKRSKVLAFEGSFHGRMLVSLASTWNKSKREPFVFPGFETQFLSIPSLVDDEILREVPKGWINFYENPQYKITQEKAFTARDQEQLDLEIKSLNEIKSQFESDDIFSVIIEPMQCEGGDRYLSARFMNALLSLAKAYQVPLIFDEVQTGFHLGQTFFWHKSFHLRNSNQEVLHPDYIVCAKKSQSGIVISFDERQFEQRLEEVNTASIIRGYYHAISLDQSRARISKLESIARKKLNLLISHYDQYIKSPRLAGLAFAFDLENPSLISKFIAKRFAHGLLFYPAGSNTLRFRMNTSFTLEDMDFLFERLNSLCNEIFQNKKSTLPEHFPANNSRLKRLYDFQELILKYKTKMYQHENICSSKALEEINNYFKESTKSKYTLEVIDEKSFSSYSKRISALQKAVYEPARQTDIKSFESCAHSGHGLAIALIDKEAQALIGISFCSSLNEHPFERGVRRDENFSNLKSVYMLDTTVDPSVNGQGIGRDLKYALTLLLMTKGYYSISGRNRDQMASSMLSINTSLGAYKSEYIKEDYPDFEDHRDVIYYTQKLTWDTEDLSLCSKITSPMRNFTPTFEYVKTHIPIMNNKICLSNFVSKDFLDHIESISKNIPEQIKHLYTTSGQSECVDKIVKSLWFKKENKNQTKLLTFEGHYFGKGSFLSRDLSGLHKDQYFETTRLKHPNGINDKDILLQIEKQFKDNCIFSVWIEPLLQKSMLEVSEDFLRSLVLLAKTYNIPLVYNETASSSYRYRQDVEFCSQIEGLCPTASMVYLGGQGGLCFLNKDFFIDTPLMVISTWDGDELSFANYNYARIKYDQDDFSKIKDEFETKLKKLLELFKIKVCTLKNTRGSFEGHIPLWLQTYFTRYNNKYIINPSYFSIIKFIEEYEQIITSKKVL